MSQDPEEKYLAEVFARQIADLRAALPTIQRNTSYDFTSRVAIDCEWDEDTGALELIGVGNRERIVQIHWAALLDIERDAAAGWLLRIVRSLPVVYHNADSDLRKMRAHGIPITVEMHKYLDDTMLAHGVLHCEEEHTLEYLGLTRGKLPPHKHLRKVAGAGDVYNGADLLETVFVMESLDGEFFMDPAAHRIYREERIAKLPYIIRDEERGVRVNQALVYPLREKFDLRRQQAARIAQAYCGRPINLNSPAAMKRIIYGIEGFPVQYAKAAPGEQGEPTLDKDALATLRRMVFTEWDPDDEPTRETAKANIATGGHPILEARYLHLGAQQAISHYVDACCVIEGKGDKAKVVGVRERIHPETRQHVQASGRDSYVGSNDPGKSGMAMQQLKGELERLVHPDVGTVWIIFDWSAIETWLLGALAGDTLILETKDKGWDIHTLNFCDVTGTPYPPLLTKALHTAPCNCAAPVFHDAAVALMKAGQTPPCPAAWREVLRWQGEDDTRRQFMKRVIYRIHYRGRADLATDIPGAKALGFDGPRLVALSETYLGKHAPIPAYWRDLEYQIDKYGVVYTFRGTPRRLTSEYRNARYREGCNHPMQGGVANIYNSTRLLIHRALPYAEFMYGKHDSQVWQVPEDRAVEARMFIEAIAQRPFAINGMQVKFPASFKERRPE